MDGPYLNLWLNFIEFLGNALTFNLCSFSVRTLLFRVFLKEFKTFLFVIFHIIIYFRSVFENFRLWFSLGFHFQFFVLMFVTFPNMSSKFVHQFEERLWKLYCPRNRLLRWSEKLFSKTQGFAEKIKLKIKENYPFLIGNLWRFWMIPNWS